MLDQPFVALIILGLAFKGAGFLVREELSLRVLVAIGTAFDIAFYLSLSPPVMPSILTNAVLVVINLALIAIILKERSTWFMTKNEKTAFENFKTLSPGQFRRVSRKARWTVAPIETVLLQEGEASDKLFFLEIDTFSLTKQGQTYTAKGPAFVGEIMLLQGGTSSASVTVPKGAIYAEWKTPDLHRMMKKSKALENALVARFGLDLADKVRNSVPMLPVEGPLSALTTPQE